MRSHFSWRGEQTISYKGVETSPERFKIARLTTICNGVKPKLNLGRVIEMGYIPI